jgi:hypothetical protein
MTRMGHSSSRAALIYQHATPEREQEIGAAVSRMIEDALDKARKGHVGGTTADDDDEEGGADAADVVG